MESDYSSNQPAPIPTGLPSPIQSDPMFDFNFEPLVDADDPGFDIDLEDSSDSDFSSSSDTDDNNSNHNDDDIDNTDDEISQLETQLRGLTCTLQSELEKQPKSTQIVLTHEVSLLYNAYQGHGSATRLSAAITAFLESGDTALRPSTRDVEDDEVGLLGRLTGRKKIVKKKIVERAKLKFEKLPPRNKEDEEEEKKVVVHETEDRHKDLPGKRKKTDGVVDGMRNGYPGGGQFGAVGDELNALRKLKQRGSPTRPKTAGKIFPGDQGIVNDPMDIRNVSEGPAQKRQRGEFGSVVNRSESSDATTVYQHTDFRDPYQTPPRRMPKNNNNFNNSGLSSSHSSGPPPLRFRATSSDHLTHGIPAHIYSLTTDEETQSLLLNTTSPPLPFNPITTLPPLPPSNATVPSIHSATISRIIKLHILSAQKFNDSLVDKYTIVVPPPQLPPPSSTTATTSSSSRPDNRSTLSPPQPPAALFRLAIASKLQADLATLYTPTTEHEHAIAPRTRALLKDIHDNKRPGKLNEVERMLVARAGGEGMEARVAAIAVMVGVANGGPAAGGGVTAATAATTAAAPLQAGGGVHVQGGAQGLQGAVGPGGAAAAIAGAGPGPGAGAGAGAAATAQQGDLDEESVEMFWDGRTKDLVAWNALRCWVEMVEGAKIVEAKRLGRY